jgi:hypothetical protein
MTEPHPDDFSNWHPEPKGDYAKAFEKLKAYMREEENLMKEVKQIITTPFLDEGAFYELQISARSNLFT